MSNHPKALVAEPNDHLRQPYQHLTHKLDLIQTSSVKTALQALNQNTFSLFIVSTSFAPDQITTLLEALKNSFHDQIIPLILVVDLNQPLSTVPGTEWGGRLGLLASNSNRKLTLATLDTLLST
jgi:PleD family two-component response regulator